MRMQEKRYSYQIPLIGLVILGLMLLCFYVLRPRILEAGSERQLSNAVSESRVAVVDKLLKQGTSPNISDVDTGWTLLMEATSKGNLGIMNLLIVQGADVNARNTTTGETPLLIAAGGLRIPHSNSLTVLENLAGVQYLLSHAASVDMPNSDGVTALMTAANRCEPEVVQLLLNNKASVNLKDNSGQTALMKAVSNNFEVPIQQRIKTVQELIVAKSDVSVVDNKGHTALVIAEQNGFSNFAYLLKKQTYFS